MPHKAPSPLHGKSTHSDISAPLLSDQLPPGVLLRHTLRSHKQWIESIEWSSGGDLLVTKSGDKTVRLWSAETGRCIRTLKSKTTPNCATLNSSGSILAAGHDNSIIIWDIASGNRVREIPVDGMIIGLVFDSEVDGKMFVFKSDGSIALRSAFSELPLEDRSGEVLGDAETHYRMFVFDPVGKQIAMGNREGLIRICDIHGGELKQIKTRVGPRVYCLALAPGGRWVAAGSSDGAIRIWDTQTLRLYRTFEGHTKIVTGLSFTPDGKCLASKSDDSSVKLWNMQKGVYMASFSEQPGVRVPPPLCFHPNLPLLAIVGSDIDVKQEERDRIIKIYELNFPVLYGQAKSGVTYTSAKVVLVGDSGVGKTGLGWRLAHGHFKEHSSTHGQQFWLLEQLCRERADGAQCEAVLWDLAGQPDYRLIHALFLDDADLALVIFDPTKSDDPLSGVEFWLKQLKKGGDGKGETPVLLIAGRLDRGSARLTREEIEGFCRNRGVAAYLPTSAKDDIGVADLINRMKELIPWDKKPATVTTETFKRIKDYVLVLKENRRRRKKILTPKELRERLEKIKKKMQFSDSEMLTAVGHLATHGYVTKLITSRGEPRILLSPELLNNLAASFVLEARRNERGLGALEEQKLLDGHYKFPELSGLASEEKNILLDSAAVLFLQHNVCFRETDPHNMGTYLVFPELINLKRPLDEEVKTVVDGVSYTVSGALENVYASLVVLMGYTRTFTRTNHWRNHARYEVGNGLVCGFRMEEEEGSGSLNFILYFETKTPEHVRVLFQSLFEGFLSRRDLTVRRFVPVKCANGHSVNRSVVRQRSSEGKNFAFCSECGGRVDLPSVDRPIQLTKAESEQRDVDRSTAERRSGFEQILFRLKAYVIETGATLPECFISYAWGNADQEHWVEHTLATDLQKAGVRVVLDRWENTRIGASIPRFVERVESCNLVVVVGTPLYRTKYSNGTPMGPASVLAAEGDLIGQRMLGTEAEKETILPVLLEGTKDSAFPPLLHPRVYADFRNAKNYFLSAFELLKSIYGLAPLDPVCEEMRELLLESELKDEQQSA